MQRELSYEATSVELSTSTFSQYMKLTYAAVVKEYPPKRGKKGLHDSRAVMFKKGIGDHVFEPYMAIKTHIETQANELLRIDEAQSKKARDDVLVIILRNLDQVCAEQEHDGFRALEYGKELRKDIDEAKRILETPAKETLLSAAIRVV
jgi:hypothetical protein